MFEVEIRALVSNKDELIEKLKAKGFSSIKKTIQHDIMLDRPDASLFLSGRKIRIRLEGDSATLTYKGDLTANKNVSKRTELNFGIEKDNVDGVIQMFTEIGYPICFQIKKERISLKNDDVEATFDEWPIIGCMVEIEGEESKIKKLAEEITPGIKFSNYRLKEMFENKVKETGKTFEELKQEYISRTGFDLGHIELILN